MNNFINTVREKIASVIKDRKEFNSLMDKQIKEKENLIEQDRQKWIKSVISDIPQKLKKVNFWHLGVSVWETYDKNDYQLIYENGERVVHLKNDALALFKEVNKLGYKCGFKYREKSNHDNPYDHFFETWVEILIFPND